MKTKAITNEEKRIKIAEACGVCTHPKEKRSWPDVGEESADYEMCECGKSARSGAMTLLEGIPDYFNDLNAMHEAEKVLISLDGGPLYADLVDWHSSAEKRAEAFGRVLSLW